MFFKLFKPKVLTDEEKMIIGTLEYSNADIDPRLSQEEISNLKETKLNENQKNCLKSLRTARKYLQEKYPGTEFVFTHCKEHWVQPGYPYDHIFIFNEKGDRDDYKMFVSEGECEDSFISKKINENIKSVLKQAFNEKGISLVDIYFTQQFGGSNEFGKDKPIGITRILIKGQKANANQIADDAREIATDIYPNICGYIDIS